MNTVDAHTGGGAPHVRLPDGPPTHPHPADTMSFTDLASGGPTAPENIKVAGDGDAVTQFQRDLRTVASLPAPLGSVLFFALTALIPLSDLDAPGTKRVGKSHALIRSPRPRGEVRIRTIPLSRASRAVLDRPDPAADPVTEPALDYLHRLDGVQDANREDVHVNRCDTDARRDRSWVACADLWPGEHLSDAVARRLTETPAAATLGTTSVLWRRALCAVTADKRIDPTDLLTFLGHIAPKRASGLEDRLDAIADRIDLIVAGAGFALDGHHLHHQ